MMMAVDAYIRARWENYKYNRICPAQYSGKENFNYRRVDCYGVGVTAFCSFDVGDLAKVAPGVPYSHVSDEYLERVAQRRTSEAQRRQREAKERREREQREADRERRRIEAQNASAEALEERVASVTGMEFSVWMEIRAKLAMMSGSLLFRELPAAPYHTSGVLNDGQTAAVTSVLSDLERKVLGAKELIDKYRVEYQSAQSAYTDDPCDDALANLNDCFELLNRAKKAHASWKLARTYMTYLIELETVQ